MKAALRAGAIDMPGKAGTDSARHLHKNPTPRMGGLAIFVGFVVLMYIVVFRLIKKASWEDRPI